LWWWSGEPTATAASEQWTVPPSPPILTNAGFECSEGFTKTQNAVGKDIWIPNGWTVVFVSGSPRLLSTRLSETDVCDKNSGGHVTRQEGIDSWYIPSQDIATPPEPGKPFDLILYQRVPATYGGGYSLSGWLASECGDDRDGALPCPANYYVAKAIGIDPNGGTDYTSPAIEWVENRTDRHWQNIYTSATALTNSITVFIRITSPFQFHNNKGFVDAFSLLRAPLSAMNTLPTKVKEIGEVAISWFGEQSRDVENIPGGNYDLLFDVQARPLPNGTWRDIVTGATTQTSTVFRAPCLDTSYQFRVRARAEQPEGEDGSSPNHRYPGVWSKPQTVLFTAPPVAPISDTVVLTPTLFMPMAARTTIKGC
jgi:hypothetical protein